MKVIFTSYSLESNQNYIIVLKANERGKECPEEMNVENSGSGHNLLPLQMKTAYPFNLKAIFLSKSKENKNI